MSTPVVIGGLTYNIPAVGESNWGQNVSDALVAVAANIAGGSFFTVVAVSSSPITVVSGRTYLVDTSAARQLNLPTPAANAYLLVRDATGTAATYNITIHRYAGEKIDGVAADKTLATNSGQWWIVSDGTDWHTLLNAPINAGLGLIVNADINASAAIARSKIAAGTVNHVLINSGAGALSSEALLAVSRGGTNSGTALNNNRVMQSAAGAIAEAAAITAARALISDANGIPVHSAVTSTELGYVSGVTSAIQTQINTLHTVPTVQKFTTGTGTYTTPAGVLFIRVRMVGGGGGGAGSGAGAGAGGDGGNTTFGTTLLIANGGKGGPTAATGGVGGTASLGAAIGIANTGGGGGSSASTLSGLQVQGGFGGVSPFGGAGVCSYTTGEGVAGVTNTGSGGGGAYGAVSTVSPSGGGAGGYVDAIITSPGASYSYAVGAAGAAGAGAAGGGAGGSGIIIVEEYYQ